MNQDTKAAPLQITKELLKPWNPCTDGYKWFLDKFPQGAAYTVVQKALRDDKRFDDCRWLTNNVWQNLILEAPAVTADVAADHTAEALAIIEATSHVEVIKVDDVPVENDAGQNCAQIGSSGDGARIGSSGEGARIGSSGYGARIGSSGYVARIGSSGYGARIGSSGYGAQIGSSGYGAWIGSSGDDAQIGSSGDGARINATGESAVIACAGLNNRARAGANGVMALPWFDEASNRTRIAVGYVGENIKADTWYSLNASGEFVEAA